MKKKTAKRKLYKAIQDAVVTAEHEDGLTITDILGTVEWTLTMFKHMEAEKILDEVDVMLGRKDEFGRDK